MLWFESEKESLIRVGVPTHFLHASAEGRIKVWRDVRNDQLVTGDVTLPIAEFRQAVERLGVPVRVIAHAGRIRPIAQFAVLLMAGFQIDPADIPSWPGFLGLVHEVCERAERSDFGSVYGTDADAERLASIAEQVYQERAT